MTDQDRLWARRFHIYAFVRISGLLVFFLGIVIGFSDLVRPGGHLAVGLVVIGLGLVEAMLGPFLLRRHWKQKDGR